MMSDKVIAQSMRKQALALSLVLSEALDVAATTDDDDTWGPLTRADNALDDVLLALAEVEDILDGRPNEDRSHLGEPT